MGFNLRGSIRLSDEGMNAKRVACFGKEESDWNDLLIEEMDSSAGF